MPGPIKKIVVYCGSGERQVFLADIITPIAGDFCVVEMLFVKLGGG
jgi:hypothetical protein